MDEWKVITQYFQEHMYPFTKHHLDSFREFLKRHIPKTIQTYNPITMIKYDDNQQVQLKVEVYVGGKNSDKIYIDRPVMYDSDGKQILLTPHEARLRNLTYQTNLFADLEVVFTKEDGSVAPPRMFPRTLLGAIPIMTHSDPCVLHNQGSEVLREMNECMYDQGGYFIIDGKEKVIVSQERITTNRLFISKLEDDQDFAYKASIRCTGEDGESALVPRTVELYLVRTPDTLFQQDVTAVMKEHKGAIMVSIPSVNGKFPLAVLFRALGVESDRAIVEHIIGDLRAEGVPRQFLDFLRPSLYGDVYTQEQALGYLKSRVFYDSIDHVKSILVSDVFPNIKGPFHLKARFLGYLVKQLMKVALGMEQPSDRDGYVFKRVDISGFLLAQLFQDTYNKIRKTCRDMLDREYYYGPWKNTGVIEDLIRKDNLHRLFPPMIMTETFVRSLKGMWGPKDQDPDQGQVQDLARISYIGFLSHLRRVNLPLDRSIKVTNPHRLHAQQWGVMCPFESPDGASIGYLKNMALLTHITFGTEPSVLEDCLDDLGVIRLNAIESKACNSKDVIRVFLNGNWYGITMEPTKLTSMLRLYRRNGLINPFTSVSWDINNGDIRVQCEAGRPCRPLFIAHGKKNGKTQEQPTWFDLVFGSTLPKEKRTEKHYYTSEYIAPYSLPMFAGKSEQEIAKTLTANQGSIEFLDIEEENTMLVAMWEKDLTNFHTHLEIHPSTVFSIVTNNIPLANHNFAPRNVFYGSQSRQAIGIYATNFTKRFDTMSYIQHYPQKPLVTTRHAHFTGNDRMPNGVNVIVAVATHTGFNQEDGLIINKSAIDRGLFQITAYKSMSVSEKKVSDREFYMFGNPIKLRDSGRQIDNIKHADYTLLNEDGFVSQESYIPRGKEAAVLGVIHVRKDVKEQRQGMLMEQVVHTSYRDASKVTDVHHYGRIDKVFVTNKGVGNTERICKIRFRKVRRPELGDKGCSRCAQKGVIGMILPAENMPFTKDGIVPDIIINAHAFPSRMTIAHLVECVFAKLCTLEGLIGDGTVFLPFDKNGMFERLETHNFEKYGNEMMYNGRTGEMINTEIFLGPTFYLRLKHMVADKVHARDKGPKVMLTHQPTSGRSKFGGLRIGEMERDVVLAHGMSAFAKEAMMEKADAYTWAVCKHCGTLAKYAPNRGIFECTGCNSSELSVIKTPYSFKLLMQELEAMGVQMRLTTEAYQELESDMSSFDEDSEGEEEAEPQIGGNFLEDIKEEELQTELDEIEAAHADDEDQAEHNAISEVQPELIGSHGELDDIEDAASENAIEDELDAAEVSSVVSSAQEASSNASEFMELVDTDSESSSGASDEEDPKKDVKTIELTTSRGYKLNEPTTLNDDESDTESNY